MSEQAKYEIGKIYSMTRSANKYKFLGYAFKCVDDSGNDCIVDENDQANTFLNFNNMNTTFNQSSGKYVINVELYHVAYFDGSDWQISSNKYRSIEEFKKCNITISRHQFPRLLTHE